jgi:hypothetical protein
MDRTRAVLKPSVGVRLHVGWYYHLDAPLGMEVSDFAAKRATPLQLHGAVGDLAREAGARVRLRGHAAEL